ncbi:MAG TPA: RNA polymerase sigma factor SigJ [Rhizomicrobium sp.]|nr:RNA polymerase sigma factor SigJ [Rhizomicrobium sp.]
MTAKDFFEVHRAHLLGIAYRMLGEMAAAEDVVQDACLKWSSTDQAGIRDARAWLSTVTIRLALDALRSARARREVYVGPWLPEPILPDDARAFAADAPAARAELASDLSLALLFILERLSPEERAAFILHDAFDCDYATIAAMLEKSEPACRKLVSRARERVREERPKQQASKDQHRDLLQRFAEATATQDEQALARLFSPDVVFYSDGGGRMPAALNPIFGADKVMRLLMALVRKFVEDGGNPDWSLAEINGRAGLVLRNHGRFDSTLDIETDGTRITSFYLVRNPEKLARVERAFTPLSSRGSSASA